jgi:hypothetical protein
LLAADRRLNFPRAGELSALQHWSRMRVSTAVLACLLAASAPAAAAAQQGGFGKSGFRYGYTYKPKEAFMTKPKQPAKRACEASGACGSDTGGGRTAEENRPGESARRYGPSVYRGWSEPPRRD